MLTASGPPTANELCPRLLREYLKGAGREGAVLSGKVPLDAREGHWTFLCNRLIADKKVGTVPQINLSSKFIRAPIGQSGRSRPLPQT